MISISGLVVLEQTAVAFQGAQTCEVLSYLLGAEVGARLVPHGEVAHGHTAAEVIHERANASKPLMGLRTTANGHLRLADAGIAKNYLDAEELEALNRIVSAYLEFAELQAMNRRPMAMDGWITKLDDFLKLSGRELLEHAGRISHDQAIEKAKQEYERFRQAHLDDPTPVERDFLEAARNIEKAKPTIPPARKKRTQS